MVAAWGSGMASEGAGRLGLWSWPVIRLSPKNRRRIVNAVDPGLVITEGTQDAGIAKSER